MKVSDFDYELPPQFIAQTPADPRDSSRLLHLDRATGGIRHLRFRDIVQLLRSDDVLVLNNTRVIKARIRARKAETGGKAEILLLRKLDDHRWDALIRGRNIGAGARLLIDGTKLSCAILRRFDRGNATIELDQPIDELLDELGELPLPPYIRQSLVVDDKYQTVYGKVKGSAAAPTAGLHFTDALLDAVRQKGVKLAFCTLHIGLDTFQPVAVENIAEHKIHSEYINLSPDGARIINEAKLGRGRVIAVGTTSARTLESAAQCSRVGAHERSHQRLASRPNMVEAFEGFTDLFITPGYQWRIVDAMITNFHLPRSTLLMMLSSFVGREALLDAYEIAKAEGYRFYSFGDAMVVT